MLVKAQRMNNDNNVLPPDFDGVFRFTNWTDNEFTAKWNSVAYTFPPLSTTPMIIAGATPEEVQHIRKKFAKELAEQEFYKSDKLKTLENQTPAGSVGSFKMAAVYTDEELKPFIQKCLDPLPVGQVKATIVAKASPKLRTDEDGNEVTRILKKGESLMANGATPLAE